MERLTELLSDLNLCYHVKSTTVENFESLSNDQKSDHCKGVRNELIRYLQSDELNFPNIIKERIAYIESNNL